MKNENYITIQGWMVNELKLSGNELICYAIIYGFCQDGDSEFSGSRAYIAESLNISKQSVSSILKSMVDKGVLSKNEIFVNGVKFCKYKTLQTIPVVKNLDRGSQETLPGGGQETCPNNTIIDITSNTKDILADARVNKVIAQTPRFDFKKAIIELGVKEQTANDWMLVRKAKKATNSKTAFERIKSEIIKSHKSPEECIRLSVEKDWKGFEAGWLNNQAGYNSQIKTSTSNYKDSKTVKLY